MRWRSMSIVVILWSLSAFSTSSLALTTNLSSADKLEIAHLLDYMEKSQCQFYRNGVWYDDQKTVREHVEKKYDYFARKGKVNSAEDFIERAATKSEMSGKAYKVRCNGAPSQPLRKWLTDELKRYRKERQLSPAGAP